MPTLHVAATLEFLPDGPRFDGSFLVDPSSPYTAISPKLRDELGLPAGAPIQTQMTNGIRLPRIDLKRPLDQIVASEILVANVTIGNRTNPAIVEIFAVPEPVIGWGTLDLLGLALDETGGRLVEKWPWPPPSAEFHVHHGIDVVDSTDEAD